MEDAFTKAFAGVEIIETYIDAENVSYILMVNPVTGKHGITAWDGDAGERVSSPTYYPTPERAAEVFGRDFAN
jgi:hypothetical protein